jgi:septum formation protein
MKERFVYLASKSPRRRDLLKQIGIACRILDVEVDEHWDGQEPADAYVRRLAELKAKRGWDQIRAIDPHPVLGADTAVVIGGEILGQPHDRADGFGMLRRLGGRTHEVYSAVAVATASGIEARVSLSRVRMRVLTDAELNAYWASREPRGKAGGYAIQGRAAAFIEHLEGSYSGVVGLPLHETAELLAGVGVAL